MRFAVFSKPLLLYGFQEYDVNRAQKSMHTLAYRTIWGALSRPAPLQSPAITWTRSSASLFIICGVSEMSSRSVRTTQVPFSNFTGMEKTSPSGIPNWPAGNTHKADHEQIKKDLEKGLRTTLIVHNFKCVCVSVCACACACAFIHIRRPAEGVRCPESGVTGSVGCLIRILGIKFWSPTRKEVLFFSTPCV